MSDYRQDIVIRVNAQNEEQGSENPREYKKSKFFPQKTGIRGKLGETIAKVNFKSVSGPALGFRATRMFTDVVGAYTQNKIRQRRHQRNMRYGAYAFAIAKLGPFGAVYTTIDMSYRIAMHTVAVGRDNDIAEYQRSISGAMRTNRSRHKGGHL